MKPVLKLNIKIERIVIYENRSSMRKWEKVGKLVVKEAMKRGLDVTAIVRGENKSLAEHTIIKDLFDLKKSDLDSFDTVVDAFGTWNPESLTQHSTSLKKLCDLLSGTNKRLIVVGGAGVYMLILNTHCS